MEAMQRALSRPSKPVVEDESPVRLDAQTHLESTAIFHSDVTLAPEDLSITPSETTDSGVYNAPTLSDDGQLAARTAGAAGGGHVHGDADDGRGAAREPVYHRR